MIWEVQLDNFVARPTPRAKLSKWGAYNPGWYTKYKDGLKKFYRSLQVPDWFDKSKPFQFVYFAVIPRPPTSKLLVPQGDVDNYAKGFLDAGNKVVWKDDKQCNFQTGFKRWAQPGEHPNVVLWIGQSGQSNEDYDLLVGDFRRHLYDAVSKVPLQLCGNKKRADSKPSVAPKGKPIRRKPR